MSLQIETGEIVFGSKEDILVYFRNLMDTNNKEQSNNRFHYEDCKEYPLLKQLNELAEYPKCEYHDYRAGIVFFVVKETNGIEGHNVPVETTHVMKRFVVIQ